MIIRIMFISLPLMLAILISCGGKHVSSNNTKNELNNMSKIDSLITILKADMELHIDVANTATDAEIKEAELKLGVQLPSSYKTFVKEFGNGAHEIHWFSEYRNFVPDTVHTDGFGSFAANTLLCLMTEDSNGGAWCWITTEHNENGEWSLAYFNIDDKKFYYKVSNFIEWLEIATTCKEEVIRELDVEEILGLG
ncbi:MAG: SMI1/KNR4 family protein [Saprospiraceae bacterium]|nr:SMI1/KNR4 family protein [Saprospiraceae bacterium]